MNAKNERKKLNMKNKIIFITLCTLFMPFLFGCSKKIKLVDIVDDNFLFNEINFSKRYAISSYLQSFDIGIVFTEPILKSDIKLGILELEIIFSNNETKRIIIDSSSRIFYSNFNKQLVNKIYLSPIDFENILFVKEIILSTKKTFPIEQKLKLLITNLDSELFFANQPKFHKKEKF